MRPKRKYTDLKTMKQWGYFEGNASKQAIHRMFLVEAADKGYRLGWAYHRTIAHYQSKSKLSHRAPKQKELTLISHSGYK